MKLNFRNKEIFNLRWKRDPKIWDIESLHDLYLRSQKRHLEKIKKQVNITNRIINEIKSDDKNKRVAFFKRKNEIFKLNFVYLEDIKQWGSGIERIDRTTGSKYRNNKLEFLLSTKNQLELGQMYEDLRGDDKQLHIKVKSVLSDLIQDKLRILYKCVYAPDILTIDISGIKYYVKLNSNQYDDKNYYKQFKLLHKVEDNIIKL